MPTRRLLVLVPLAALLVGGCGSDPKPRPALAPVRLTVDAPLDAATVDAGSVEVHGRVSPAGARVLVAGDDAAAGDGSFSATVALQPGANVIDIQAAAPNRPAAMTAVRVVRRVPVVVPDVTGEAPDDAVRRLEDLGLKTRLQDAGGLLDNLLPGTVGVCGTDPPAGEKLRAGSTVTVQTAKSC